MTPQRPRRRDRHGRGLHGPLVPPWLPAGRVSRADRFDELVADAVDRLAADWGDALRGVDVVVTESPGGRSPTRRHRRSPSAGWTPLTGGPPRLVLHRRPIERRTSDGADRADLVADVVAELVADLTGLTPEQVDPGYPRAE